jgi:hypothetical protein
MAGGTPGGTLRFGDGLGGPSFAPFAARASLPAASRAAKGGLPFASLPLDSRLLTTDWIHEISLDPMFIL